MGSLVKSEQILLGDKIEQEVVIFPKSDQIKKTHHTKEWEFYSVSKA
jgi:hypothetical protein